ncbi:unnamed protein product [Malus baccata var. baccata]
MGGISIVATGSQGSSNYMEALKSPLMGLFEKRIACKFILYVQDYSETNPKTHEGMDLTRVTTRDLIVDFIEEGKVIGVTSEGETAKCKKVVCDPSYLPNKVRKVGKVARVIAIMSHPIPNTNEYHLV